MILLFVGIGNAGVIDRLQMFFEYGLDNIDLLNGDVRLGQLGIGYPLAENLIYQIADTFFGIVLQ